MTALWATSPSPGTLQMPAAGQGPTNLAAPFAWQRQCRSCLDATVLDVDALPVVNRESRAAPSLHSQQGLRLMVPTPSGPLAIARRAARRAAVAPILGGRRGQRRAPGRLVEAGEGDGADRERADRLAVVAAA